MNSLITFSPGNKENGEIVAIKKFKESEEDEAVRKTTLREARETLFPNCNGLTFAARRSPLAARRLPIADR